MAATLTNKCLDKGLLVSSGWAAAVSAYDGTRPALAAAVAELRAADATADVADETPAPMAERTFHVNVETMPPPEEEADAVVGDPSPEALRGPFSAPITIIFSVLTTRQRLSTTITAFSALMASTEFICARSAAE